MTDAEKRLAALQRANHVRSYRAMFRRQLKAGTISLREVLEHETVQRAKLAEILTALPGIGDTKVKVAFGRRNLPTHITVQGVSPSTLAALCDLLNIDPDHTRNTTP